MTKTTNIIDTGDYSVYVGNKAIMDLNRFVNGIEYKNAKFFILVDENTLKHCLPMVVAQIERLGDAEIIEVESGEESKSIDVCVQIWKTLSEYGADRKSVLVNLGGGVITDLGGFVASTFKRGIDFINIPTTLLAQVDASIGGKTGIDLNYLKNEIGVFSNPKAVYINPDFLTTLDERHLLSGFAEVIKHALIADKSYWKKIKSFSLSDISGITELIQQSIEIKNTIVASDPKEQGIRKSLNFGHTVGHAIESFFMEGTSKSLFHGESVAIGMICEAYLSYKKTKLNHEELDEITSYIFSVFNFVKLESFDEHRLIELMRHDKKNTKGEINFTLIGKIGKAEIDKKCSIELIKESLKYYREQCHLINQ